MADGNKTPRSKHIPVHIDAETYKSLQTYSELTGIPITRVVADGMKDWMETIGAARMEAFTASAHGDTPAAKLLQMRAAAPVIAAAAGAKQEVTASA